EAVGVEGDVALPVAADGGAEVGAAVAAQQEIGAAQAEAVAPQQGVIARQDAHLALRIRGGAGAVPAAEAAGAAPQRQLRRRQRRVELEGDRAAVAAAADHSSRPFSQVAMSAISSGQTWCCTG